MTNKKARIPWNKGLKNCQIPWNKGLKTGELTDEHKQKISEANKGKIKNKEHKKKISESNKGKPKYEEHKRKISESKIKSNLKGENSPNFGKHLSEETRKKIGDAERGEKSHCFGKHLTEEHRKKLSESNKGKFNRENNPNWIDGRSFEPYCPKFNDKLKTRVRQRDNFTCQLCGAKENGRKHPCHHVHYDKDNCYPDLITLCVKCNAKVNFDREYYEKLFMNKLNERGLLYWTCRVEKDDKYDFKSVQIIWDSLTHYQQRQKILKIIDEKYGLPKDIEELLA